MADSEGHDLETSAAAGQVPTAASESRRYIGDLLVQPVILGSLAVLLLNDHIAKPRWPSELTGKLSDVAGLVFFPLLLVSLCEAGLWMLRRDRWMLSRRTLLVAIAITALGFVAIKTWTPAGNVFRVANGVARWPLDAATALVRGNGVPPITKAGLIRDRSDLIALAALAVPWCVGTRVLGAKRRPPDAVATPTGSTEANFPTR